MSQVQPTGRSGPNFKSTEAVNRSLCPTTGKPKRSCTCRPCIGRRNKRKGSRGQSKARRQLEGLTGMQALFRGRLAHEEQWDHLPLRVEAKTGKAGGANAVWAAFSKCKAQSDAAHSIGDPRPFVAAFVPDGSNRVLWVIDGGPNGDGLARLVEALINV